MEGEEREEWGEEEWGRETQLLPRFKLSDTSTFLSPTLCFMHSPLQQAAPLPSSVDSDPFSAIGSPGQHSSPTIFITISQTFSPGSTGEV